jgi:hypothetical protein
MRMEADLIMVSMRMEAYLLKHARLILSRIDRIYVDRRYMKN